MIYILYYFTVTEFKIIIIIILKYVHVEQLIELKKNEYKHKMRRLGSGKHWKLELTSLFLSCEKIKQETNHKLLFQKASFTPLYHNNTIQLHFIFPEWPMKKPARKHPKSKML